MKKLLTSVLALNFLVEGPVGAFLVFTPQTFLPPGEVAGILWARNYGVAALAIASLIFWVWPHRDHFKVMGVTLGFLMSFHSALTIALLTTGGQQAGAAFHFTLATLCTLLYFRRAKWCTIEQS